MEKCIGCELCAGVCPADCIYVRGLDNPPDHPVSPGERYGYVYEINFLRCIHCDMCVEACPTEAITESKLMEFSFTNRNDAIYTKEELLVDDDGQAPAPAVGGLARGRRPAHLGMDAGHVAVGECRVRGRGPVVGRARLRCAVPRGRAVRQPRRRRHRDPSSCGTPSSAICVRATCPRPSGGPRGAIGRMLEKAERFAPGAGKKHRQKADAEYAAVGDRRQHRAGRSRHGHPAPLPAASGGPPPAPNRARPDARHAQAVGAVLTARPRPSTPHGSTWGPSRWRPPSCWPGPSAWWWPATRSTRR